MTAEEEGTHDVQHAPARHITVIRNARWAASQEEEEEAANEEPITYIIHNILNIPLPCHICQNIDCLVGFGPF